MDNDDLAKLRDIQRPGFKTSTISMTYRVNDGGTGLRNAMAVRRRG
jgi:hypothetical protein